MGLFSPLVPFVDVELKMAGMFTARKKIQKENGAEPDELEDSVAQAMFDLEVSANDLKAELHDLYFVSAKEFDVPGGKKAITITVPYRLLKNYHKNNVQQRLVRELEKKFSGKHVVIVAQRKIQQKILRRSRGSTQKRPRSRTLTAVHDAILEDLVYPGDCRQADPCAHGWNQADPRVPGPQGSDQHRVQVGELRLGVQEADRQGCCLRLPDQCCGMKRCCPSRFATPY